jgi:hypothetical protein
MWKANNQWKQYGYSAPYDGKGSFGMWSGELINLTSITCVLDG